MTDIADAVAELAGLWPALAAALARDTAVADGPPARTPVAATVVNPDVLAAIITLDHDVPETVKWACNDISEHWVYRDLSGCLHQLPRMAGRMHTLGHITAEKNLEWQASSWLRMVKRALGLRKPDMPLPGRPDCPLVATYPERHAVTATLFLAGAELFLGPSRDGCGLRADEVTSDLIYCASPDCGASWDYALWTHLGHLLEQAAAEARNAA